MSGTVTFAYMNVQGMGDIRKRRDVLNLLKAKQYNIYCLQDTHLTDNDIPFTRSIWGFEWYFNNSSQFRGVAILINNIFYYKFKRNEKDNTGNLPILHFSTYEIDLSLFCIYGPNKDSPQFYEYTRKNMTETENNCVLVGDLVLSPEKVYFNYMHLNNPKCYWNDAWFRPDRLLERRPHGR